MGAAEEISMTTVKLASLLTLVALVIGPATTAQVHDPGLRGGDPGAGGPLTGLAPEEQTFFKATLERFKEVDSVFGDIPGEGGAGLGPRFNGNSCAQCHAHPAVGGSSPGLNPQVALANDAGATNQIPAFIRADRSEERRVG